MRLADISGGLIGALGIDLTDIVMNGGLLGAATGRKAGGLGDFLYRPEDKSKNKQLPYFPGQDDGGLMKLPYYPGTQKNQRLHGIADFDGSYNPTFDIPGGPITSEEMQRMNQMYPIGNIGK